MCYKITYGVFLTGRVSDYRTSPSFIQVLHLYRWLDEVSSQDGFPSLMQVIEKVNSYDKVKVYVSSQLESQIANILIKETILKLANPYYLYYHIGHANRAPPRLGSLVVLVEFAWAVDSGILWHFILSKFNHNDASSDMYIKR
jgi:hypothetical protein